MNKRLKILFSVLLVFALFVSCFSIPASSFETGVETSTADMLLINLDTDTVVFSQKPDNMWYAGYLSKLMTYLVSAETISEPDKATFKVEESFIDDLPFSDGSLDKFVGETLTATDLTVIMLLTSGSDAAYALADVSSGGDIDAFVKQMNDRAAQLGCKNTGYVSPGYNDTSDHYTTCRDLYKLYMQVKEHKSFNEIMQLQEYTPDGLEGDDYTISVETSILNTKSPYYFRYTNDAVYSYTKETYAGIALTTTYRGKTYFYAGLLGLNESERNAYADAKKLTTWAYLNLSDRKMFNDDDSLSGVTVSTHWGEYTIGLYTENSAFKTLPNSYVESKLSYQFELPDKVKAPIIAGESVGKAKITYEGNEVEDINLVSNTDEGLGMLHDTGRFVDYAYTGLFPLSDMKKSYDPQTEAQIETEAVEETKAAAEAPKATAAPATER